MQMLLHTQLQKQRQRRRRPQRRAAASRPSSSSRPAKRRAGGAGALGQPAAMEAVRRHQLPLPVPLWQMVREVVCGGVGHEGVNANTWASLPTDAQCVSISTCPSVFTCHAAVSGEYEALLAGSYDRYVRNQHAAPEWQDAPDQMEQVGCLPASAKGLCLDFCHCVLS